MKLHPREERILEYALNFLKANLEDEAAYVFSGHAIPIPAPQEAEIDRLLYKLQEHAKSAPIEVYLASR